MMRTRSKVSDLRIAAIPDDCLSKIMALLGLYDTIAFSAVSSHLRRVACAHMTRLMRVWVEGILHKSIGPDNTTKLFLALESGAIKDFLFCGGTFLQLLSGRPLDSDMDLLVVPIDDINFSDTLERDLSLNVLSYKFPSPRTPMVVHDIKCRDPVSAKVLIDIVFRHSVFPSTWIDADVFATGLAFKDGVYSAQIFGHREARNQEIKAKLHMSWGRQDKYVKRGYLVFHF
jgi:hypothetical protein